MTDDNSQTLVDIPEDLKDFKTTFYGKDEPEAKEDTGDDTPATDEDRDAVEETDEDAPTEESDDPEAEDESDDKSEEEDKPEDTGKRKKPSAQTRINELTRSYRQEQRERAQERAEFVARIEALETLVKPLPSRSNRY
jgi:hypothetical protein